MLSCFTMFYTTMVYYPVYCPEWVGKETTALRTVRDAHLIPDRHRIFMPKCYSFASSSNMAGMQHQPKLS